MVGCWGNLIYLAGKDEARRKAILDEAIPGFRWLMENAGDNPRALWIKGGLRDGRSAAGEGGDPAKAGGDAAPRRRRRLARGARRRTPPPSGRRRGEAPRT